MSGNYKYAKVWVDNKTNEEIIFTMTKGSKGGSIMPGTYSRIAPRTQVEIRCREPLSWGYYYANFTSPYANMVGSTACRKASSFGELG